MLHEDATSVEAETPAAHAAAYCDVLGTIVADRGVETVTAETGIDEATLRALAESGPTGGDGTETVFDGESTETGEASAVADGETTVTETLALEDAAAIQALDSELDAETIHAEACDNLLLGMSMAVLDVDTIAAEYAGELSGKGIQQRLERRTPTTLAEFARIEHFVASRR